MLVWSAHLSHDCAFFFSSLMSGKDRKSAPALHFLAFVGLCHTHNIIQTGGFVCNRYMSTKPRLMPFRLLGNPAL